MSSQSARERLQAALSKIEARIEAAEARPTREEIESLKNARAEDLKEIINLREQIQAILKDD